MATVIRKGQQVETIGNLQKIGEIAPSFILIKTDLNEFSLQDLKNKQIILNIFPSIDTPTCDASVREFNKKAASFEDVVVVCVSADLPFALGRFCGAEGIENVLVGSSFRSSFGKDYGVTFTTGLLTGLLSRAIVLIDKKGKITYTEQVSDTSYEPNYNKVLSFL
ncbi:thiol peroxidase [Arcobacter sp. LA11]|uniref:thiol peroxidase n=1 Tax=Arcobacter sp. LA11 TaxID=1898176 RepID=UPI000933FFBA|nr:thiol peroxidase [Arcobacter sp. LA11]